MKFSKQKTFLVLALSTTMMLSACDKSDKTEPEATDSTEVSTEKGDTSSTESSSTDSSFVATQMAKQSMQAFTLPLLMSGQLNEKQKSCLQNMDEDLAVDETKKYLDDLYTPEEMQAMNEAYSSDLMKKVNKFTEEQMLIMTGQTVANPTPQPTAEEMAEFKAMFEDDPRLKRLMEMQENQNPEENEFIQVLKPVINDELKRCEIDITL